MLFFIRCGINNVSFVDTDGLPHSLQIQCIIV